MGGTHRYSLPSSSCFCSSSRCRSVKSQRTPVPYRKLEFSTRTAPHTGAKRPLAPPLHVRIGPIAPPGLVSGTVLPGVLETLQCIGPRPPTGPFCVALPTRQQRATGRCVSVWRSRSTLRVSGPRDPGRTLLGFIGRASAPAAGRRLLQSPPGGHNGLPERLPRLRSPLSPGALAMLSPYPPGIPGVVRQAC